MDDIIDIKITSTIMTDLTSNLMISIMGDVVAVNDNWLLDGGVWNDLGVWEDDDNWED